MESFSSGWLVASVTLLMIFAINSYIERRKQQKKSLAESKVLTSKWAMIVVESEDLVQFAQSIATHFTHYRAIEIGSQSNPRRLPKLVIERLETGENFTRCSYQILNRAGERIIGGTAWIDTNDQARMAKIIYNCAAMYLFDDR